MNLLNIRMPVLMHRHWIPAAAGWQANLPEQAALPARNIKRLLKMTAWPMDAPKPYSFFHIAACLVFLTAAVFLARRLARPGRSGNAWVGGALPDSGDTLRPDSRRICRILFVCGLILAAGEIYKQLFLYYVIYGSYNWWYFPFQLCSTPMYLCLFTPLLRRNRNIFRTVCTFLQDFSLLGGVMALAEPSGLLHPYWSLTMHGLLWHAVLVLIGLFLAFTGAPRSSPKDYLRTLPLLALFCAVATAINIATGGAADMFYISPFYPVTQVVFYQLSLRLGTGAGILIYLFGLCAGGFICHVLASRLHPPAAEIDFRRS